jgi:hypothetical protein
MDVQARIFTPIQILPGHIPVFDQPRDEKNRLMKAAHQTICFQMLSLWMFRYKTAFLAI